MGVLSGISITFSCYEQKHRTISDSATANSPEATSVGSSVFGAVPLSICSKQVRISIDACPASRVRA
jgi:hypothetical protein